LHCGDRNMAFSDILCPMLSLDADESALAAAEVVAQRADGRITALMVELEPDPIYTFEGAIERTLLADAQVQIHKEFEAQQHKLEARARGPRGFDVRALAVTAGGAGAALGEEARQADLTIMLRPGGAPMEDLRTAIAEGILFGSGRPLLLIPPLWRGDAIGRNIVVGWNGKREAARALADAAPFMDQAASVTVVCVALGASRSQADASGQAIVSHLARRGKRAELRHAGELGFSDGATLFGQAGALGADLVVMGGYGSPRMLEMIVGGVTREAMTSARIPVLMSH
jgi:nucleotide-binding universal stress UspA family protein